MTTIRQNPQPNRRGSHRKPPRRSVKVECRKGAMGFGPNIAAGFLDLSESGIRLLAAEPLEARQEAEILLTSYGMSRPIKRLAEVCWCLPLEDGQFVVGMHFQKRLTFREVQTLALP